MIYSRVENHNLRYSGRRSHFLCLVIFQKEILCSSRRIRIFSKNDPEGKVCFGQSGRRTDNFWGNTNKGLFWQSFDKILLTEEIPVRYELSAVGQEDDMIQDNFCGRCVSSFTRWTLLCCSRYSCFFKIVEKAIIIKSENTTMKNAISRFWRSQPRGDSVFTRGLFLSARSRCFFHFSKCS